MVNTRAVFKLALRHCKAVEKQLKADGRAKQLANKQNPRAFWNSIRRDSCKRVSSCVNKVENAVGASDISNMWQTQFSQLYNSLDTSRTKREYLNRVSDGVQFEQCSIRVNEVSVALRQQKRIKVQDPMAFSWNH